MSEILDQLNEEFKRLSSAQDNPDAIYFDSVVYEILTHPRADEFFKLLDKYFLSKPVAPPNVPHAYSNFWEGQNHFIRNVLMGAIERHQKRRRTV